jgi:site-specific DNA recombinase
VLERQFTDLLGQLSFDDEVLDWARTALRESHADEKREHEAAIERYQVEYHRLQNRLDAMYVDKLDGRINAAFFDRMATEWRSEQDRCLREIERHQSANQTYIEEGVQLLELARNTQCLFAKQEPREKRRLLNFVVSNCSWKDSQLSATFRQPFDLLAQTASRVRRSARSPASISAKREIWRGRVGLEPTTDCLRVGLCTVFIHFNSSHIVALNLHKYLKDHIK